MSGVEPWSFVSKIMGADRERPEGLAGYDRALADAQALAATRGSQLDATTETLKAAEQQIQALEIELQVAQAALCSSS